MVSVKVKELMDLVNKNCSTCRFKNIKCPDDCNSEYFAWEPNFKNKDAEVVEEVEKSCDNCRLSIRNNGKGVSYTELLGDGAHCSGGLNKWQQIEQAEEKKKLVQADNPMFQSDYDLTGMEDDAPIVTNSQGGKQRKTGTTEEAKHYQVADIQPIDIMQDLKNVLDLKYEIAKCKNSDYGDSFSIIMNKFNDYGINPYHAIYLRIADKFHRFENLIFNNNQQVKDESIADTLTDLSNYIDLFIAWKLKKES